MDFSLTEDQKMFKDTLREFMEKEVSPIVDKRDREGPLSKTEIHEWYKKFQQLGIAFDPETAKTYLSDPLFLGITMEEISRVWPSLAAILGYQAFAGLVPVASDSTRERLLSKLNKAELIGTIAVSEPEAGCDNRMIKSSAVLDGDEYVLNGQKTWITNATVADVALVLALNKETGMQEFFFVDKEASPYETSELHKIGWNACPTGEMFFNDCRVPKKNSLMEMVATAATSEEGLGALPLVGGEGMMKLFQTTSPMSAFFAPMRASMALMATGISQAALDASLSYAKERVQFGKPIGKFQLIQEMLYKMATITESSRLLAYKAFDAMQRGDPETRKFSSLAKGYACEGCVKVTYYAMQIHGGMGLSNELPLERYFRDARMMTVPDGTSEIMKLIVGYEMLGKGYSAYV